MNEFPRHTPYVATMGGLKFPLFKFMKKEHAESLLVNGEVYLPNMFDFRNVNKHVGIIGDETEGILIIENEYTHYAGRAKDAEGLIPIAHQAYEMVMVRNYKVVYRIKSPDALIYCTTSSLFSDTLIWAMQDGKNSCVMIMDPILLFSEVHNKIKNEYDVLGPQSCAYIKNDHGEIFEKNPTVSSETNFLLSNTIHALFAKPKKHETQREARTIFFPKNLVTDDASDNSLKAKTISVPEVKSTLLEIVFENTDTEILLGQKTGVIYMKVNRFLGELTVFSIQEPHGVFSPVFFEGPSSEIMMGFCYPNDKKEWVGPTIINCDIGVIGLGGPVVFASNTISNIKNLEIYTG